MFIEFNLIKPMDSRDGIDIFNVCDLIDWDQDQALDDDLFSARLKEFQAEKGASYYSACREDFSIYEAVELAKAEGKSAVVVEDLS